ncbi:Rid family hydrolase [Pseudodonghicola flavimaris]|uniref:Rid family hydrolase n=1 Tax=Pseudodonghicola flavimaris TaxID=3050036 RepID=A0ABT7F2S6_9RHOB|nr:Rid family hydrolase [Pseudodonghicola flavimaris]MDK3018764.1 Rid family hydrolase [Pseudodonghicola flavimaris]
MKDRIFSGASAEDFAGFAKAVIDGRHIHVSGTLGQDPETGALPEAVDAQLENALASVEKTLAEAGFAMAEVKQARVFITDAAYLKDVAMVLGRTFGDIRPTNTLLVCQIPTPGAKVEIEISAAHPAG